MKKIAILQPHILHYREEFFAKLAEKVSCKIFYYKSKEWVTKNHFQNAAIKAEKINSFSLGPFLFYSPFPFLKKDTKELVLMLDFKHITTWALLLTKFIHRKKIILWGHGISIKRFLIDEKKTLIPLKWFLSIADGVWFYTENELDIWKKRLPNLNTVSLNNTISGIQNILNVKEVSQDKKNELKKKNSIKESIIFIYCARFNTLNRRIDLLLEVIEKLDKEKYGFVIIGGGNDKPNFSKFENVYDFGSIYDFSKKTELFQLADIYFQPAWVGLSIVEAMAYGKPVFTFKRSKDVYQCVEYHNIIEGINGKIFEKMDDFLSLINHINEAELKIMRQNAKIYAENNLSIENMVNNALSIL